MLARLMSNLLVDGEILLDNIKAVIFDKDGTLIDIHHYWASMIKIRASLVALKCFNDNDNEQYNVQYVQYNTMYNRIDRFHHRPPQKYDNEMTFRYY